MKAKNIIISAALALGLSAGLVACKSQADKDAELKAKVEAVAPGVTVSVKEGVVTLSGQVNDANAKGTLEESVKKVSGVKSVTNQLNVPPPPVINPDQTLIDAMAVITKDYPKVQANVSGGVVTLTGEVAKADLQKLIQKVQESKPKEVKNNLVIK